MKIRITKRVIDKLTKESFTPNDVIERDPKRCQNFIDAGVAELVKDEVKKDVKEIEVTEEQPKPELPKPKKKRKK